MANNNIISYQQKCVDFGLKTNSFLLNRMDKGEVERAVLEQIDILGGNAWLYNRVNRNMKNGVFDPFFLEEHCKVYAWRERFFDSHFHGDSWFTVETDLDGDYYEDYFSWDDPFARFITIPVQITRHFDTVTALATAKVEPELKWLKSKVYFENDEILSNEAESKYKLETMMADLNEEFVAESFSQSDKHPLKYHYDEINLTFCHVAHIVTEAYRKGPKKLEELAIKTVLKEGISVDRLPVTLQKKIVNGMYAISDNTPDNITDEGKIVFEKLRKVFMMNSNV